MMEFVWIWWFVFCLGCVVAMAILLNHFCEMKRTEKIAKIVRDSMPQYMDEVGKFTRDLTKGLTDEMIESFKKMNETEY